MRKNRGISEECLVGRRMPLGPKSPSARTGHKNMGGTRGLGSGTSYGQSSGEQACWKLPFLF